MTSRRRWVYSFGNGTADGDPKRKDILGGKGASLAEMCLAGMPVPPGFTICVDACNAYHDSGGVWPEGLEDQLRQGLRKLEETTGRKFAAPDSPLLVSVRSGAAVSMPGMMDTILNCGMDPAQAASAPDKEQFWKEYGDFVAQLAKSLAGVDLAKGPPAGNGLPDEKKPERLARLYESATGSPLPASPWDALKLCVEAVFDSFNSERAKAYRQAHDIRGVCGTAVTVQSMYASEVSGVAFTANPAAPDADEIVIESTRGLGELVVSGEVTPDRFILDRKSLAIKQKIIADEGTGKGPSLDDQQVKELAGLALKVRKLFGFPVDVEWGLVEGKFALLQARGIRGLDVAEDVEVGRQDQISRLRQRWSGQRKLWVMHNLAETLPAPTPLTWDIIKNFMSPSGGFGLMYRDLGYIPSKLADREGLLDLICGRIYVDPDRMAGLFWGEMPFEYDCREILEDASVLEAAPTKFNADKAGSAFLLHLPRALFAAVRSARRMKRAKRQAQSRFEQDVLPDYLAYIDQARSTDLAALTTRQLLAELDNRIERVMNRFGPESLKPGLVAGLAESELARLLEQLLGPSEGRALCLALTAGLDGDTTVEQNIMLHKVSRDEARLEDFLEAYGHRAVGEMELATPRWREDASFIEKMLAGYKRRGPGDPEALHRDKAKARMKAQEELPDILGKCGASFLLPKVLSLAEKAQKLLPYREAGKHYLMMGYELVRATLVELSERWRIGRDVFFLHLDELGRFEQSRDRLLAEVAKRKVRWQSLQKLDAPRIIDSTRLDDLGIAEELPSAEQMEAVALAPGIAVGLAIIASTPEEAVELGENRILVCPSTDPGWAAVFPFISGLVVERGGVLSHGAITARDFGIPAVTCAGATGRIPAGAKVRVDGHLGSVSIIEAVE